MVVESFKYFVDDLHSKPFSPVIPRIDLLKSLNSTDVVMKFCGEGNFVNWFSHFGTIRNVCFFECLIEIWRREVGFISFRNCLFFRFWKMIR